MVALLRVLRADGDPRWWLVVGALVGVGLMNKALLVFPVVGLVVAFVVCGPRKMFATRYFALAVGIGLVLWAPYLWWQARHGWPQWALSRAIAGGSSGTSNSPLEFVLVQLVLAGLFAVPVWGYGWWRLWREPRYRGFAVAYVLLFVVFLVTGGKGYYLAGMYPVLVAAGAVPFAAWLGAHGRAWVAVVPAGLVNAAMAVVLFLPVFPVAALAHSPIVAVNYDMGETVGWPDLVAQVAAARARYAPSAGLLTANYGEAGALERFGAAYGLPTPRSGHNSYWWWGPLPDAEPVLTVGIDAERLTALCADLRPAGRLDNGLDLDNDEQHAPLSVCTPRVPWATAWPRMKGLG
ncbi:glycosyltransferase family 39 protein [Nocardia sp. NPDC003482]